jgi:integrase
MRLKGRGAAPGRWSAERDKDRPPVGRPIDADGLIRNGWFRNQVWKPACLAAGLGAGVRPHDMRHAHASDHWQAGRPCGS